MNKFKKKEAFDRAVAAFGEWRTWGRSEHIAYGLIRGVPFQAMERYSNDIPPYSGIATQLAKLGAWPAPDPGADKWKVFYEHVDEVKALVAWVKKPVREKRIRPSRAENVSAAPE